MTFEGACKEILLFNYFDSLFDKFLTPISVPRFAKDQAGRKNTGTEYCDCLWVVTPPGWEENYTGNYYCDCLWAIIGLVARGCPGFSLGRLEQLRCKGYLSFIMNWCQVGISVEVPVKVLHVAALVYKGWICMASLVPPTCPL